MTSHISFVEDFRINERKNMLDSFDVIKLMGKQCEISFENSTARQQDQRDLAYKKHMRKRKDLIFN